MLQLRLIIEIRNKRTAWQDIEMFIPSQTYRRFLRENQIELNVTQIAKLIYISHNSEDGEMLTESFMAFRIGRCRIREFFRRRGDHRMMWSWLSLWMRTANFSHEHIPVVELEKADWGEIPKDKQLVLQCDLDLVKGRGIQAKQRK